ncbi:hypothetical protein TVAG_097120 [Trichomonas vaginalis G3]|uniref:Uncharacterized protein n=1 Tax=Trichomonas vaginalis (strain ATCC PRA-98 / G3) TaxID=412133 RepID=A2GLT7_TRIV3|nr:hypothetical protein TVAG_097120 [Trichomonas vaginalis G3]|eukprot:XP_001294809.1 hypothetical protein [Trichomonas vaginalis G3]
MSERVQRFFDQLSAQDELISVGQAMRVHHIVFDDELSKEHEETVLAMFIMKWYEKHRDVEVSYAQLVDEFRTYRHKVDELLEKRRMKE